MRVVVLISGRGSNLEALIKHQKNYMIKHVISNHLKAGGMDIAKTHGITNTYINWSDRTKAEKQLADVIESTQADLIVLAGFMRILSPYTTELFNNKIINIHPSLLPKHPGLNTHQKVIDSGDLKHGASVHLVDSQLDHGRVLAQTQFDIKPSTNAKLLAEQLIFKEHKLLTTVVGLIGSKDLAWDDKHIYTAGEKMFKPLIID